jgi:adenylyltransferase/sulfurtransferase
MVGTIQAVETLKLILGIGRTLAGRLMMIDALTMQTREVQIDRDPECPACGTRTITQLIDYDEFCGTPSLAAAKSEAPVREIEPAALAEKLARGDDFDLIDVREPHETAIDGIVGARLIPLGTLGNQIASLRRAREIVVMCRAGGRSATAARQLQEAGFTRVTSLAGGMLRWQREAPAPEFTR